jgi:hypothetical protein
MINTYKYNTVSDAIRSLRGDGFNADFTLDGGSIYLNGKQIMAKNLKAVIVYRYEGVSDPADEATVYGLETVEGTKGILVTGDEISEVESVSILTKLHKSIGESGD